MMGCGVVSCYCCVLIVPFRSVPLCPRFVCVAWCGVVLCGAVVAVVSVVRLCCCVLKCFVAFCYVWRRPLCFAVSKLS